jgi:hypothetical protein
MRTLLHVVIFALLVTARASAQFPPEFPLKGVRLVYLGGLKLDDETVRAGVDTSSLRTSIELRLREAGLRIATTTDTAIDGFVEVEVTTVRSPAAPNLLAFRYTISFEQAVTIQRNGRWLFATTWNDGGVAIVGSAKYDSGVREEVVRQLERFLNDWLKANPR